MIHCIQRKRKFIIIYNTINYIILVFESMCYNIPNYPKVILDIQQKLY